VFRVLISIAAAHGFTPRCFDFTNAFANADMKESIYMQIPEGYLIYGRKSVPFPDDLIIAQNNGKEIALLLHKSLYGGKQSARNWYLDLASILEKHGFKRSIWDEGLFYFSNNTCWMLLAVWVDDLLVVSSNDDTVTEIMKNIGTTYKLKETFDTVLGMKLTMSNLGISLSQSSYIESKAKEFGLEDSRKVYTPMDAGLVLVERQDDDNYTERPYRELLGSLMHAMVSTRLTLVMLLVCYQGFQIVILKFTGMRLNVLTHNKE
jgi:virulence-associated protein VapD